MKISHFIKKNKKYRKVVVYQFCKFCKKPISFGDRCKFCFDLLGDK